MQSEQRKSAESSAGSRGRQEDARTNRDAGPYLKIHSWQAGTGAWGQASGWGLAVSGLMMQQQVRSTQHSVL
jgi:hypothetical protein